MFEQVLKFWQDLFPLILTNFSSLSIPPKLTRIVWNWNSNMFSALWELLFLNHILCGFLYKISYQANAQSFLENILWLLHYSISLNVSNIVTNNFLFKSNIQIKMFCILNLWKINLHWILVYSVDTSCLTFTLCLEKVKRSTTKLMLNFW